MYLQKTSVFHLVRLSSLWYSTHGILNSWRLFSKQVVQLYADVMELADMQDLGSCAERRGGSSPFIRTKT